jgi:ubiquinone/menaquinone biosynthesis C-methylase UbiE
MKSATLELLREPGTGDSLEIQAGTLVNPKTGRRYALRDGIPLFAESATGQNHKYQHMYDRIARCYDLGDWLGRCYFWLRRARNPRKKLVAELALPPAGRVLEVSIGTGLNVLHLPAAIEVFGLDLSWGMLARCCRNLARWKRSAELFQGEGENLPFKDDSFDAVLHTGGINFFNDKSRAMREMVRVAKPGAKIVISDETEEAVKGLYEKTPLIKSYYHDRDQPVSCPINEVPPGMLEVQATELLFGKLYCLSFRKP